jgi:hypothetical protein
VTGFGSLIVCFLAFSLSSFLGLPPLPLLLESFSLITSLFKLKLLLNLCIFHLLFFLSLVKFLLFCLLLHDCPSHLCFSALPWRPHHCTTMVFLTLLKIKRYTLLLVPLLDLKSFSQTFFLLRNELDVDLMSHYQPGLLLNS